MSRQPTGTSADEERLLALERREEGYAVEVTPVLERMDGPDAPEAGTIVDWSADDDDGVPMLVFGPVDANEAGGEPSSEGRDAASAERDAAETGEATADAGRSRRCYEADGAVYAPVPGTLLSADPPDGLGLDLDSYDPANPLLFEALATDVTVGVLPVRFDDGTPYDRRPREDTPADSDPVAEAAIEHDDVEGEVDADPTPRPETVSAPIDPDVLRETVAATAVEPDALVAIVEAIERHDLVGEGETASGYPPLSVDERVVHVFDSPVWEDELAGRLERTLSRDLELGGDDRDALEAAAAVHERQARRLIGRAGTDAAEYRGAEDEHALVVTDERDTAEWETTDPRR